MGIINKIKRMLPKVAFEYHNKRHFFNPLMAYWYALCPFLKKYGVSRHKALLGSLSKMGGGKSAYCRLLQQETNQSNK